MTMIRATRLLNKIEDGLITGATLETSLANTTTLSDWNYLLQTNEKCKRIATNPTSMGVVTASATAINKVVKSTTAATVMSQYTTANNSILGASSNVGNYLNQLLINDFGGDGYSSISSLATISAIAGNSAAMNGLATSPTAMAAIATSSTAMTAIAASSTAMSVIAGSSVAMTEITKISTAVSAISANVTASNYVLGSSYKVGKYLNQVILNTGNVGNGTLEGLSTMAQVAGSNTALAALFGNATIRGLLYDSSNASSTLFSTANSQTYMTSIAISSNNNSTTIVNATATGVKTYFIQQWDTSGISTYASYAGFNGDYSYTTTSSSPVYRLTKGVNLRHYQSNTVGGYFSVVTYIVMQ